MLMALGLIAPPVLAAIASSVELPSQEVGAVQALVVAFGVLAEGVSPLAFGLLLDASAGSAWPGIPLVVGGVTAALGWCCANAAMRRRGMDWRKGLTDRLVRPVGLATPTGLR